MEDSRENRAEEVKKKLAEALSVFGINILEEESAPKEEPQEELRDYEMMTDKTQKKIDELNLKSEELIKKTGMTREALDAYISNPANFNKEQWAALQKIREAAEEIKKATYEELLNKKRGAVAEKPAKKKAPFGKRKRWISL